MNDEPLPNSEIILYQTEDDRTRVQCRFEDETLADADSDCRAIPHDGAQHQSASEGDLRGG